MKNINKVILAELMSGIFLMVCFFVFWALSASDLFDFTYFERKVFNLVSATSFILIFLIPLFVVIIIGSTSPELKTDYARFKKQFQSLKKIQKIGLLIAIFGLILLAISYIVPIYLEFFYGFIPFKLLYDLFFILGPFVLALGFIIFLFFFGFKNLKHAKTWSDLFKDEES